MILTQVKKIKHVYYSNFSTPFSAGKVQGQRSAELTWPELCAGQADGSEGIPSRSRMVLLYSVGVSATSGDVGVSALTPWLSWQLITNQACIRTTHNMLSKIVFRCILFSQLQKQRIPEGLLSL